MVNGRPATGLGFADRGLCYGHGLFETMRLYQGQLPLWSYHCARLVKGLAVLAIDLDPVRLDAELTSALAAFPRDGLVKLVVTAGEGARGYWARGSEPPTVIIQWFPHTTAKLASTSLQVLSYRLPRNPVLAGVKHLNRLDQVIAARELGGGGHGLLLDSEGQAIEALSHNLFLYHDGQWLTPALDQCGVAGVMRALLLDRLLPDLGWAAQTATVPLAQVTAAREVFICNAVAGVVPVSAINGTGLADDRPRTARIRAKLEESFPCFTA